MAEITVRFHKRLYPRAAINKTAADFVSAAKITLEDTPGYHVAVITAPDDPVEARRLEGEFLNYVLMLAKSLR